MEERVNGTEDSIVMKMLKHFPQAKAYDIDRCLQNRRKRFMGLMESHSLWRTVNLVFLWRPDAEPKNGIRSHRALALTFVVSKWYATCIILRLENKKEPEEWKQMYVVGIVGISCHRVQVMMTQLLQEH